MITKGIILNRDLKYDLMSFFLDLEFCVGWFFNFEHIEVDFAYITASVIINKLVFICK